MPRTRLLVALVPPQPLRAELRALRGLLGHTGAERVPPHITLVPPVNVPVERRDAALLIAREAATTALRFELVLGPAASFAPRNPTVHLSSNLPDELIALRDRLRRGVLDRPDEHPFVPHLTLRHRGSDVQTRQAPHVLGGTLPPWQVDRLVVFEQVRDEQGTRWLAVAEEPFGPPAVVGRGGIEVALRTVGLVDEPSPEDGPFARTVRVVAERPGDPEQVGNAAGRLGGDVARLDRLEVAEAHRGMGIGRHLLARWCSEVADAGAAVVIADVAADEPDGLAMLRAAGFTAAAGLALRRLGTGPAGSVGDLGRPGRDGVVGS